MYWPRRTSCGCADGSLPTGWGASLAELREALKAGNGTPEGGPALYTEAARAAARQLQPLALLLSAVGQTQLLQLRIASQLRAMSR